MPIDKLKLWAETLLSRGLLFLQLVYGGSVGQFLALLLRGVNIQVSIFTSKWV